MARVTFWLAALSLAAGVVAAVVGVRVGHGQSDLSSHLNWGVLSVFLQLFTALVAGVHARASTREVEALRAALREAQHRGEAGKEPRAGRAPGGLLSAKEAGSPEGK